jgi:hypothetical protein
LFAVCLDRRQHLWDCHPDSDWHWFPLHPPAAVTTQTTLHAVVVDNPVSVPITVERSGAVDTKQHFGFVKIHRLPFEDCQRRVFGILRFVERKNALTFLSVKPSFLAK